MTGKEKICSSQARAASTLFYTKKSRVSRIWAITDTSTGDEKRTGEVPTYGMWDYYSGFLCVDLMGINCIIVIITIVIFADYFEHND